MARPSVLPLADTADQHIRSHITTLREHFPARQGTRPFLSLFLALVHEATGQVYGADTVRKLLQTYASEFSPSTNTIHSEIRAFRQRLQERGDEASTITPEHFQQLRGRLALQQARIVELEQQVRLITLERDTYKDMVETMKGAMGKIGADTENK